MAEASGSTVAAKEAKGYTRTRIPWIVDMINVTDPELMRKITSHVDIDRIHGVPKEERPWWIKAYFPVTRFQDHNDDMFVPLTSTKDPRYSKRVEYVKERVVNGISAEDVEKVALLLHTAAPQAELAQAVVNAVNRRFYGKEVPADIVKSAGKTCDKLLDAVTSGYLPPLHHQNKVLDFIEKNSGRHEGCPAADFSHHIGASVILLTEAVKFLHKEKDRDMPIKDIFTKADMPLTVKTPRIAINDTTVGGILDKPAKGKWTVFVLEIRKAAAETGNTLFTFGAGVDDRQCAFRHAFLAFMGDLQKELKKLEGGGGQSDLGGGAAAAEETKESEATSVE